MCVCIYIYIYVYIHIIADSLSLSRRVALMMTVDLPGLSYLKQYD